MILSEHLETKDFQIEYHLLKSTFVQTKEFKDLEEKVYYFVRKSEFSMPIDLEQPFLGLSDVTNIFR